MNQKLRLRILKKLAQTTQTPAPSTTAPPVGSPPGLPGQLTATLAVAYNTATIPPLTNLFNILHKSLHYASNGKNNYAKMQQNATFDPKDAHGAVKEIGDVAKQVYSTFGHNGTAHVGLYNAQQIGTWADTILGSTAYNSLPTLNPTDPLASKIQSAASGKSLKDAIRSELEAIKKANPITT